MLIGSEDEILALVKKAVNAALDERDRRQDTTPADAVPRLALTRMEAAQALGVSEGTIANFEKRGLLVASRLSRTGRAVRYDIDDIRQLVKDLKKQQGT